MNFCRSYIKLFAFYIYLLLFSVSSVCGGAQQLDSSNFDHIIGSNELVFINFYADWCRFSNMLAPTWDETAELVKSSNPEPGRVVIAKVDCDSETSIATRYHISKYPTLKLIRNGQPAKREYRGQRSAESMANFIKEQLRDPISKISHLEELQKLEDKKRIVIGYFEGEDVPDYELFQKVATSLKEDCHFYAGFGDAVRSMHPPGQSVIAFKSSITKEDDAFTGDYTSYDELSIWATERCIPLVREITFENAEELTEEGIPFLILFHASDDTESIQKFTKVIQEQLIDQKQSVNFLTADGLQFAHPLHHLGKSKNDLPLIAIDSFRHMYLFPDYNQMEIPGKLKQFLLDLHSGKLHREFHYGPDPDSTPEVAKIEQQQQPTSGDSGGNGARTGGNTNKKPTSPPESTFRKLAPSKNRYTLLKDEL